MGAKSCRFLFAFQTSAYFSLAYDVRKTVLQFSLTTAVNDLVVFGLMWRAVCRA